MMITKHLKHHNGEKTMRVPFAMHTFKKNLLELIDNFKNNPEK